MKVESIKVSQLLYNNGLWLRLGINDFSFEERKKLETLNENGINSKAVVYLNRETGDGVLIIELRSK